MYCKQLVCMHMCTIELQLQFLENIELLAITRLLLAIPVCLGRNTQLHIGLPLELSCIRQVTRAKSTSSAVVKHQRMLKTTSNEKSLFKRDAAPLYRSLVTPCCTSTFTHFFAGQQREELCSTSPGQSRAITGPHPLLTHCTT